MLRNALIALLIAMLGIASAAAQSYPSRPVRLIVPYAAGGLGDVLGRLLAQRLSESLGQQFLVENRAGAAGTLGSAVVARAAPDGHTLLLAIDNHATNPHLFKSLDYNTLTDFAPVSLLVRGPMLLVVRSKFPVNNIAELMQYARARPGAINFATAGTGSPGRLALESLKYATGLDLTGVNYKGAGPAMSDLIGDQVDMMFSTVPTVAPHLKQGRLKLIAITSERRNDIAPGVPALSETVPGYALEVWAGLFAPAKTSPAIIELLHGETSRFLLSGELRNRLQELGLEPVGSKPAELQAWVQSQLQRWGRIIQAQRIALD